MKLPEVDTYRYSSISDLLSLSDECKSSVGNIEVCRTDGVRVLNFEKIESQVNLLLDSLISYCRTESEAIAVTLEKNGCLYPFDELPKCKISKPQKSNRSEV